MRASRAEYQRSVRAEKPAWYVAAKRRETVRRYGLEVEDYEAMVVRQSGLCAICHRPSDGVLHVDHDHGCCPRMKGCAACVRGLLCQDCNLGIGRLSDSPERLRSAADYLTEVRPSDG